MTIHGVHIIRILGVVAIALMFLIQHLGAGALAKGPETSTSTAQNKIHALLESAEKAFKEKNHWRAIALYSRVIRMAPDHGSAYLSRGMSYEAVGKTKRGVADYRKALELDPKEYRAMENLAYILERDGKKIHEAIDLYEKALALDPRPAWQEDLRVWIAILKTRLKQEDESAVRMWRKGNEHLRNGEPDSAESCYSKAVELDPRLFQAYFGRGNLRMAKEDYSGALADFNLGLKMSPVYPGGYIQRGLALEKMECFHKALRDYQRAREVAPSDPWVHYHLGRILERFDAPGLAYLCYKRVLKLKPKPELRSLTRKRLGELRSAGQRRRLGVARLFEKRKGLW